MSDVTVKYHGADAPTYQTAGAAGCDLRAAAPCTIPPGGWAAVSTGLHLEIPEGYEGQVRSRSGSALKSGIFVLNSPGTIDSDYRGEVKVILANLGPSEYSITIGDRVAQLVICPIIRASFVNDENMSSTDRGTGGFGSTGR